MSQLAKPIESTMPSWVLKMREAAQRAISEQDLEEIVKKQVEKAKQGDAGALKFVFEQVLGGAALKGATFVQQNFNDQPATSAPRPVESAERLSPTDLAAKARIDRHAIEDRALGLVCGRCGFEPEHPDRTKRCSKCNATQWQHLTTRLAV